MLVKTYAAAVQGISAIEVTIEVNVSQGIRFLMVGLPDNAVKESHERIYSALQYNGIAIPRKQVIINMAPADIRKEGSAYDLPLAIVDDREPFDFVALQKRNATDDVYEKILRGYLSAEEQAAYLKRFLQHDLKDFTVASDDLKFYRFIQ